MGSILVGEAILGARLGAWSRGATKSVPFGEVGVADLAHDAESASPTPSPAAAEPSLEPASSQNGRPEDGSYGLGPSLPYWLKSPCGVCVSQVTTFHITHVSMSRAIVQRRGGGIDDFREAPLGEDPNLLCSALLRFSRSAAILASSLARRLQHLRLSSVAGDGILEPSKAELGWCRMRLAAGMCWSPMMWRSSSLRCVHQSGIWNGTVIGRCRSLYSSGTLL